MKNFDDHHMSLTEGSRVAEVPYLEGTGTRVVYVQYGRMHHGNMRFPVTDPPPLPTPSPPVNKQTDVPSDMYENISFGNSLVGRG